MLQLAQEGLLGMKIPLQNTGHFRRDLSLIGAITSLLSAYNL
jgi:hypothetical protein